MNAAVNYDEQHVVPYQTISEFQRVAIVSNRGKTIDPIPLKFENPDDNNMDFTIVHSVILHHLKDPIVLLVLLVNLQYQLCMLKRYSTSTWKASLHPEISFPHGSTVTAVSSTVNPTRTRTTALVFTSSTNLVKWISISNDRKTLKLHSDSEMSKHFPESFIWKDQQQHAPVSAVDIQTSNEIERISVVGFHSGDIVLSKVDTNSKKLLASKSIVALDGPVSSVALFNDSICWNAVVLGTIGNASTYSKIFETQDSNHNAAAPLILPPQVNDSLLSVKVVVTNNNDAITIIVSTYDNFILAYKRINETFELQWLKQCVGVVYGINVGVESANEEYIPRLTLASTYGIHTLRLDPAFVVTKVSDFLGITATTEEEANNSEKDKVINALKSWRSASIPASSTTIEVLFNDITLTLVEKPPLGIVWPSGKALATYIMNSNLKGKKILELGAGTGICSLLCAAKGASVIATDMPNGVELLEENVRLNFELISNNGGRMEAKSLVWGEFNDEKLTQEFDYILAADTLYHRESQSAFKKTLEEYMTPGVTVALLCFPNRSGQSLEFVESELKTSFEEDLVTELQNDKGVLYLRGYRKTAAT